MDSDRNEPYNNPMRKNHELKAIVPADQASSPEDVAADLKKRLALIDKEFSEGLEFIGKYAKSVTIFGSSMLNESDPYCFKARKLAEMISKNGYAIVTGGGPGIMEAANRGAQDAGGQSVGLNIRLPHEQKQNPYLNDSHEFYYFFSRKMALTFGAEAFVFFPGGFGTLNEFFEIATLIQTERMPHVPMILVGSNFWKPLDQFIREHLFKRHNMIEESALSLYTILDDEQKVLDLILKAPIMETVPFPQEE